MPLRMLRRRVSRLILAAGLAGLALTTPSSQGPHADSTAPPELLRPQASRSGHTAVLLDSGQVWLSGGRGADGASPEAELFDPEKQLFLPAPNQGPRYPRHDHTTTALPAGFLLTLGGDLGGGPSESAEIATASREVDAWFSSQKRRSGHTATLLPDGRVLILGGRDPSGAFLRDAEIFQPNLADDRPYDPETGAFSGVGTALAMARADHTATLLPDGRILIVGGRNEAGELATAEILDPATGKSRALQATLAMPRADHTATLRPDGNVAVLGGFGPEGAALRDAEVFVLQEELFTPARRLREARAGHTATLLATGQILVTGGESEAGLVASAELLPAIPVKTHPQVAAALPTSGARDVPLNQLIGVRFSQPLDVRTIRDATFVLSGPRGTVPALVSSAEAGLYAFLVPQAPLEPQTRYVVHLSEGLNGTSSTALSPADWAFETRGREDDVENALGLSQPKAGPQVHVDAGPDQILTLPVLATVSGTFTYSGGYPDECPIPSWAKVSGPGTVTFIDPSAPPGGLARWACPESPQVRLALIQVPGTYVLEFTVGYSGLVASDQLTITVSARGDMNGDGKPDLMWQERAGTGLKVWTMGGPNGLDRTAEVTPTPATYPGVNQKIVAFGDFDGDGKSDWLVQRNAQAKIFVYYMDGVTAKPPGSPVFVADAPNGDQNWMVVGAPDLNHDGKPDLLLQHQLDGTLQVWYMDGITVTSTGTINGLPANGPNPKIVSVDDFNGDGNADLLYQRPLTGKMFVAYLSGADFVSQVFLTPAFPSTDPNDQVNWRVVGSGDYNGDGKPDVMFKHELTGQLRALLMNGVTRIDPEMPVNPAYFNPADPVQSVEWWVYGNFAWYRGRLGTPVITPTTGTFTGPIDVTITPWTGSTVPWTGATLRYTTNGADPDLTSPVYTGPLFLDQTLTSLKAQASQFGWVSSQVATAGPYSFTVATPVISLPSGTYPSGQRTTVTCATPGALIHYTTNGVEPTEADPTISSGASLVIDRNFTLKAKAWKNGSQPSATATATYTVSDPKSILYIVGTLTDSRELAVRDHLATMGYDVVLVDDNDPNLTRNAAADHSLVLFSSSVGSGITALHGFWDVTVPIVSFESELWDEFRMASTTTVVPATQLQIALPDHPLAAHRTGTVTIYQNATNLVEASVVAPGADVVATRPTSTPAAFFGIETGGRLLGGDVARGRRVGIFDPRPSVSGPSLTPDGWALFDAAINWAGEPHRPKALFVGAQVDPPTPEDQIAVDHLASLGYSVTVRYSVEDPTLPGYEAYLLEAVNGMALVAISSSSVGADATTQLFRHRAVPIVIWKAMHFDDLGLAAGRGVTTVSGPFLTVTNPDHPLAGGLPAGSVNVTSPSSGSTFGWCQPRPSGVSIANIPDFSDRAGVFGYEIGALLQASPEERTPERRVGLFMDPPTIFGTLTDAGWRFFDAAIEWATGGDPDNDGLTNKEESAWGTNPHNADSNDDGILDGAAVAAGLSPTNPDMDGDGVANGDERRRGTDPFNWDTDGDGCSDNPNVPGGDQFPLDPLRCAAPVDVPGIPGITLNEPTATLIGTTCSPSPCP